MSNMSHCRFHNTLGDLRQCREALYCMDDPRTELSQGEFKALLSLMKVCKELADNYIDEETGEVSV